MGLLGFCFLDFVLAGLLVSRHKGFRCPTPETAEGKGPGLTALGFRV